MRRNPTRHLALHILGVKQARVFRRWHGSLRVPLVASPYFTIGPLKARLAHMGYWYASIREGGLGSFMVHVHGRSDGGVWNEPNARELCTPEDLIVLLFSFSKEILSRRKDTGDSCISFNLKEKPDV